MAILRRRTCLKFRVVRPLSHLLLADEVINNAYADWWLCVVPLHDDQWAAGLIGIGQLQPGNIGTNMECSTAILSML